MRRTPTSSRWQPSPTSATLCIRYSQSGDANDLLTVVRAADPDKRLTLVNKKDAKGNTALHYAVYNGHAQAAQVLLSYLADPNFFKPPGNNTLLHWCCSMQHKDIARLLVNAGADVAQANKRDQLCYEIAPPGHQKDMKAFVLSTHDRYRNCMMRVLGVVPSLPQRAIYRIAFDKVDTDSNGWLDHEEMRMLLRNLMQSEPSQDDFKAFIEWFDKDGDGKITFTEYMCGVLKGFHSRNTTSNPLHQKMATLMRDHSNVDADTVLKVTQSFRITTSQRQQTGIGNV